MSISDLGARLGGWPRRVLALACLLVAVATALPRGRADQVPRGSPVVIAARDLPSGARLSSSDVRIQSWPARLTLEGAIARQTQVIGHRLSGPMRAGEPITDTRLAGVGITTGLAPELRAVPVEITGSASPSLVHVGDLIDLLAGDPPDELSSAAPSARVLAEAVRVLAVAGPSADAGPQATTLGLIVAADQSTASRIAAATGRPIVATVRRPP